MRTSKTAYGDTSAMITTLLLALLMSTPVFAQDTDESESISAPAETKVSSETDPDAEASADSADEESEADTETDSERPPDNYRPSEDISEDLGVSFPVDI